MTISRAELATLRLETALLDAEAKGIAWQARYAVALDGWNLAEATLHEVRTGHRMTASRPPRCGDCRWSGRPNPYLVGETF
jgi:hypothetical protein